MESPNTLLKKIIADHKYDTRRSRQSFIQWGPDFRAKKTLTPNSLRWYGSSNYNMIQSDIRNSADIRTFKSKLIPWIRDNVPS